MPRKNRNSAERDSIQAHIDKIWAEMWAATPGHGNAAPRLVQLADFTRRDQTDETRELFMQALFRMYDVEGALPQFTNIDRTSAYFSNGTSVQILEVLQTWEGMASAPECPPNPLRVLLEGYGAQIMKSSFRPGAKGTLPEISAEREKWKILHDFSGLPVDLGGGRMGIQQYLPTLMDDSQTKRPALIAVMDRLAELHRQDNAGGGNMPTLPVRIFVELLMSLGRIERDGVTREKTVAVSTIIEQWLRWNKKSYKPSQKGILLQGGVESVRRLCIPTSRYGYYYPVMLNDVTGWGLDDVLTFLIRIPKGKSDATGVGPPIDVRMARDLGAKSFHAYRAYIGLVYDWDHSAARRSILVTPTREAVRRTASGQIIDQKGRPVFENGKPVTRQNHPLAVSVGNGERELNPVRETKYRKYDEAGLRRLALPSYLASQTKYRSRYTKQAVDATCLIAEMEGCVIETLGHDGGFPWRVMAPDSFNLLPMHYEEPTPQLKLP